MLSLCLFSHRSGLGGAEKSLLDLVKILIAENIRCIIIMQGDGPLNSACKELGIETKTFDLLGWWCSQNKNEDINKALYSTFENHLFEIIEYVKYFAPTAIYTQSIVSPIGALVAEHLNLPHFSAIREYGEIDHGLHFPFGFSKCMNKLYKSSDYIFSITKSTAKIVLPKYHLKNNIKVNYSKVNIVEAPKNKEEKLSSSTNIGIIGTIQEGKNQQDLIEATFVLLDQGLDVKLYIIGGSSRGFYYEKVMNIVDKSLHKEKIIFTGHLDNPLDTMSQLDIVVSCAEYEGLGRTLIEAILLKIPIIYANSGGPKEIYNSNYGLSYQAHNIQDLTNTLLKTISNKNETQQRINNAYIYVNEKFTDSAYVSPVIEALNSVKDIKPKRKKNYLIKFFEKNLNIDTLSQLKIPSITLRIDNGYGYSALNSINFKVQREPFVQTFKFNLSRFDSIKDLFIEILDTYCIVKIDKLVTMYENQESNLLSKIATNGIEDEAVHYFNHKSPNIYLKEIPDKINYVLIKIQYLYIENMALYKINKKITRENINLKSLILKKSSYKVVFFGASSALEKKYEEFLAKGIIPDYICDNSSTKHGLFFKEQIIMDPDVIFSQGCKFIVVITSSYVEEIRLQLKIYSSIESVYDLKILKYF